MKAVIIDDELQARSTLKKFLSAYCPEVSVRAECDSITAGFECIVNNTAPDILFLDVQLADGDGFDLLQRLPQINFEIIFTTGYNNYAIKAIKYAAIDYLVKPINPEELREAVSRVMKKKAKYNSLDNPLPSRMNGRIAIADSDGFRVVQLAKIVYCKAEGNYTLFIFSDGEKILVCKNLKEYECVLPQSSFLRIHNSYLINLEHLKSYVRGRGGQVEMSNGEFLDVARNRKQLLLDVMMSNFTV
jgi:two-component system, LytTR family, response regulator